MRQIHWQRVLIIETSRQRLPNASPQIVSSLLSPLSLFFVPAFIFLHGCATYSRLVLVGVKGAHLRQFMSNWNEQHFAVCTRLFLFPFHPHSFLLFSPFISSFFFCL